MSGGGDDESAVLDDLRQQVSELRRALEEIGGGGVDALVVSDPNDPSDAQIYTLTSADRPYRVILDHMGEGAVTVSEQGVVLYANPRIGVFLGIEPGAMVGRDVAEFVPVEHLTVLTQLLTQAEEPTRRAELTLAPADGPLVPCLVTATDLPIDGAVLRCLVFTDLTMQKLVEQQVAQQAARQERQQVAIEVNDTIVQGLVAAEMALDLGQHDYARRVVTRTSRHARHWIGQLASEGSLTPGDAVRSHPARSGEATP